MMSAKKWAFMTNATGMYASAGRYGGTYARIEIAFEFCMWLNPVLKIISIETSIEGKDLNSIFSNVFERQDNEIDQSCYLYLMQDLSTMLYKIGISKTPTYREKTLQSEKPTVNMLCYKRFINRKDAYIIEQTIHANFKKNRVRGEWFSFCSSEIQQIENYILN
ncbi:MAG: GIY-YIG nuclease family protein [Runella zeae]